MFDSLSIIREPLEYRVPDVCMFNLRHDFDYSSHVPGLNVLTKILTDDGITWPQD